MQVPGDLQLVFDEDTTAAVNRTKKQPMSTRANQVRKTLDSA